MKKLYFILLLLFTHLVFADECAECQSKLRGLDYDTTEKLSNEINKTLAKHFVKVADLKINHAGTGDLSLLVDENGNALAVRFHYVDGKEQKDFTVTMEEFNQGKGIDYPAYKNNVSPLKLKAIIPPGIDKLKGGEFNLVLGTNTDPAKYKNNLIKLVKNNGNWKILNDDKEVKKVTLSPGISWASWDGTFQEAKFE